MKYTKEQRLEIGRRIYEGEVNRFEAAAEYDIGPNTAREYMRLYRAEHKLPVRRGKSNVGGNQSASQTTSEAGGLRGYEQGGID